MNPTKIWKNIHSRRSSRSPSASGRRPSDSNPQQTTLDDLPGHAVRAASAVASASTGFPIRSNSLDTQLLLLPAAQSPSTSTDNFQLISSGSKTSPPFEKKHGWMATAYSGAKLALEASRVSSDLKDVAEGLSELLVQYADCIVNKDAVRGLVLRLNNLASSLTKNLIKQDIKELERKHDLRRKLAKVQETIDTMLKQSKYSALLNNADQAMKIASLVNDIQDAIVDYENFLQQDLNETTFAHIEPSDLLLLEQLQRSNNAGYSFGNRQKCLKGTRVKILAAIEQWLQHHHDHRVYWLNGVAGTGKTTIAQSFAERVFAEGLFGASFFCSRDFPDRRDLHFIFPTLAFQLACTSPVFRAHLVKSIKSNPDVVHGSLDNQLKKLLVEPLQSTKLFTVIIIDGLDECEDNQPASTILSLLSREIDHIPLVKFFITGRPESPIQEGFRLSTLRPLTEILLLHEVDRGDQYADIRTFLTYHVKKIVENRKDMDVMTPWPSQEDIQIAASKTGGLFIYAFTIINFLASSTHNPQERLRVITSIPHSSIYEGKSGIDPLYTCMMDKSFAHVGRDNFGFFSRVLRVVSSVVLLWEPISVASLARLLALDSSGILASIRPLHSVLLVPDSDSEQIRVFHKSFPDYITDHERCRDARFYVDSPVHHALLTICCFELMKMDLKNTCDLPQSAMNQATNDLSTHQQEPTDEVLVYACRFWAKHLCSTSQTGKDVARILELLKEFIQCHLLQWLKVLSIINGLRGAVRSLLHVERWLLQVQGCDKGLVKSIRECLRFTLYTFNGIAQPASHIYDSALLWLPTSSLIRTSYQGQLTTRVKLLNGVDSSWNCCISAVKLGVGDAKPVWSVGFSHGGNLLVGCNESVVKVLEVATGLCLATLNGHNGDVYSVAFSPDDVFLASGSKDSTIRVWDVQTGALVRTLAGHTGEVNSVAFSSAGTMIASGASDTTVRVWNLSSGKCEHVFEGHSNSVRSVCWLQAGKVVSGCDDRRVKVWNLSGGKCLKSFHDHSNFVRSVASSPDASKIASASDDKTIRVYYSQTGNVLQTIFTDGLVRSVCFSPDGEKVVYATSASVFVWDLSKGLATFKWQSSSLSVTFSPDGSCVAVGSEDGFMRVLQVATENQDREVHEQHSKEVRCISVSPNEQMIGSGSYDKTVKLWDTTTGACVQTFHGHSYSVLSVTFSPDSSLVASGSADTTVRIWSVHGGSMITSLKGHDNSVFGVVFSPDGRRIVSISEYQEVILWDVEKWGKLAIWTPPIHKQFDSRVYFSTDGTQVMLEFGDEVKGWEIRFTADYSFDPNHAAASPSSNASSKAISLPIVLVPITEDLPATSDNAPMRLYRYTIGSEWIMDEQNRHVCWIPPDRRDVSSYCSYGKKVALGYTSGRVVVFDFSDTSVG